MSLLDQIRSNDAELTALSFDDIPMEYFRKAGDLVEAFRGNTSITHVRFEKDFLSCLMGGAKEEVIEGLANLKGLKEVYFGDSTMMVHSLACFISKSAGLTSFTTNNVVLQGTQDDFDDLEKSLYRHENLKTFDLGSYTCANQDVQMDSIKSLSGDDKFQTKLKELKQVNAAAFAA